MSEQKLSMHDHGNCELCDEIEARLEATMTFENQPSIHMLRIIADDLDERNTHEGIMRARAGWLRRFSSVLAAAQEMAK